MSLILILQQNFKQFKNKNTVQNPTAKTIK
jgi:hypothetical protein